VDIETIQVWRIEGTYFYDICTPLEYTPYFYLDTRELQEPYVVGQREITNLLGAL
jgi:hypothetical protein